MAIVGVLVGLLCALWIATQDRSEPHSLSLPSTPSVESTTPELPRSERVDLLPGQSAKELASLVPEPDAPLSKRFAWAPPSRYEFTLRGTVRDVWWESQPSAKVFLAVEGERFTRCAALDERGSFSLRFEANQARVSVHVFVYLDGSSVRGIETLDMVAGETQSLALDLLNLAVKCGSSNSATAMLQGATEGPPQRVEPGGLTRFLALENVGPTQPQDLDREGRSFNLEFGSLVDPGEPDCSARGRVMTSAGEPAVGVRVLIRNYSLETDASTTTDHNGDWHYDTIHPGMLFLSAGGDDFGLAQLHRRCSPGGSVSWDAKLDRQEEVRGRLLGPDDEPLPFLVRAEGTGDWGRGWTDMTVAGEDGRFAFPNARARSMRLFVIDPTANPLGIPLFVNDTLRPGQAERVFKINRRELERASVSIRLVDDMGEPIQNAEVRLLNPATKRGVFLRRSSTGGLQGRYSASGLPMGSYYMEVIVPKLGSKLIEEIEARIPGEINLGTHRFDSPGRLRVDRAGPGLEDIVEWRITQRLHAVNALVWAGADLGAVKGTEAPGGRVELPAGEYLLSLRTASVGNISYPFRIISGLETVLDVEYADTSEVTIMSPAGKEGEYSISDEATGTEVCRYSWAPQAGPWTLSLLPGFYRVRLERDRSARVGQRFEVTPVTPLTVGLR